MVGDRKDRQSRLTVPRAGAWATSSQDYLLLATDLYGHSASYAKRVDGNCSPYALAGVPILVSTLRALLIEASAGVLGSGEDRDALRRLAEDQNEVALLREKYLSDAHAIANDLALLQEVRNEIVHPTHMPAGSRHNTPTNMIVLRERGLLQSTGEADADFVWLAQLQSHRLFRWAFATTEAIARRIIDRHASVDEFRSMFLQCYRRYEEHDH